MFNVLDVVRAGLEVVSECYPRLLTGKGYPTRERNVYVTTLYVAMGEPRGENFTVVEVEPVPVGEAVGTRAS